MTPPKNNSHGPTVTAALAAAGLGLGGALGYIFQSPPAPSAPVTAASAASAAATPAPAPAEARTPPSPYDVPLLLKGSSRDLSEFEAWLRTATCDEVTRVLLDPLVNTYPGNTPLNELLVRRFREFSVNDRFTCLQKRLGDKVQINQYELLPIFSDLAKDTLPNRADEMLALFKKGNQLDDYSLATTLKDWAAADPAAALAFVDKLGNQGNRLTGLIIAGLADKDPALASQLALKLPPGRARGEALRGVAANMAKKDLGAALDWLNQSGAWDRGNGPYSTDPTEGVIGTAVNANPAAAAQLLVDRPGLFENQQGPRQVSALFRQWAGKDPAAVAAWLAAHPLSETHQKAAESALQQASLTRLPMDEALNAWAALPADARSGSLNDLTQRLMSEDPAHAVERLAAVLPQQEREETLGKLLAYLPAGDFSLAMPYLKELGSYIEKNSHIADRFSYLPADQLEAMIKGLPEKAADLVRAASLENMMDGDSGQALVMMGESGREKLDPFNASRLAVSLSETDPQKASEWVAGFPEGPGKEAATRNLVANWAKFDTPAATAWLQTLPPGPSRDRASLEVAKVQSMTGSSEAALTLASGIQDSGNRTQATGYALQTLWRKDPAAAASSLAASGLPPADQATLTEKLKTGAFSR